MKKIFIFLVAACIGLAAAAQQPSGSQTAFTSLSVNQFVDSIGKSSVVLVDVRTQKEYETGHIKNASNIVWDKNFDTTVEQAKLDNTKTIAVYCRSGRRSKAAAQALASKGFRVIELNTGILGWQQAGMPVEK